MNSLSRFDEKIDVILEMEKAWRKTYVHRRPCDEWLKHKEIFGYGFCKHYVRARRKHFKKQIDELWDITKWDGNLYNWVYISNR